MQYVSLHNHTTHSLYDGLGAPQDFYQYVLQTGGDSMAITEHGNMNSLGYAMTAAKIMAKKGIKFRPIYGVEAYVVPSIAEWRKLKEAGTQQDEATAVIENESESKSRHYDPLKRRHHLVITALNNTGLANLFNLVTLSYRPENFYRFPRMDFDMLRRFNDGLAISTACLAGLPTYLSLRTRGKDILRFKDYLWQQYDAELLPLLEIFGRDRAFLELQFNALPEQQIVNEDLIEYSKLSGYKLIVASDAHYCRPELWKEREIYKSLGRRMMSAEFDASSIPQSVEQLECELYPHSADQIYANYKRYSGHLPDDVVRSAIQRTHDIAWHLMADVQPDGKVKLPPFVPSFKQANTPLQELTLLCEQRLQDLGRQDDDVYRKRLEYELGIIADKDAAAYFLTKKKILDTLRKRLLLGVGRGSGAGSLVCYLLKITLADPIQGNLLFERFLSPSRAGNPDIDSDCEDKELAFELLKNEFGEFNTIAISNYNRLGLKSLVKDVSRLYNVPFDEVNKVTKVVEDEAKPLIMEEINQDQKLYELTFAKAYQHSPTFKSFIDRYPQVAECLAQLHKNLKTIGRHAGGVLIVPDSERHLPVIRVKNTYQCPFTEGITAQHLEMFGLIKFDVLGLSTLSIIRRCIELVLHKQGMAEPTMEDVWRFYDSHLHPDVIDPADQKVFKNVYHAGRWCSTFQFAESGVQGFCQKAKPRSVTDLAAVTSVWRPGALSNQGDQKYLDFSPARFRREHSIIQDVLGETKGLMIFQESFMLLAHKLAGFTLDEADKLRKMLVKPSNELSDDLKRERVIVGNKFIAGCMSKGVTRERSEELWHKEILPWCSYGFNKSHAYVYAYVSYHCAWLMTYHEEEWIKACLEKDPDQEKTVNAVSLLGYTIQKPDINLSLADEWQIIDKKCLPPFTSIKGIGDSGASELVRLRTQEFADLYDFFYSTNDSGVHEWRWSKFNKTALRALVRLEAFDSLMSVGEDHAFKNYRHMEQVLFETEKVFDKLKKGKYKESRKRDAPWINMRFEEFVAGQQQRDYTLKERVNTQIELTGIFDKNLLFTRKQKAFVEHNGLKHLSQLQKAECFYWFFVDKVTPSVTENGKEYTKINLSDGQGHKRTVNIFDFEVSSSLVNKLCVAKLYLRDDWVNSKTSIRSIPE